MGPAAPLSLASHGAWALISLYCNIFMFTYLLSTMIPWTPWKQALSLIEVYFPITKHGVEHTTGTLLVFAGWLAGWLSLPPQTLPNETVLSSKFSAITNARQGASLNLQVLISKFPGGTYQPVLPMGWASPLCQSTLCSVGLLENATQWLQARRRRQPCLQPVLRHRSPAGWGDVTVTSPTGQDDFSPPQYEPSEPYNHGKFPISSTSYAIFQRIWFYLKISATVWNSFLPCA